MTQTTYHSDNRPLNANGAGGSADRIAESVPRISPETHALLTRRLCQARQHLRQQQAEDFARWGCLFRAINEAQDAINRSDRHAIARWLYDACTLEMDLTEYRDPQTHCVVGEVMYTEVDEAYEAEVDARQQSVESPLAFLLRERARDTEWLRVAMRGVLSAGEPLASMSAVAEELVSGLSEEQP